jgi:hypothetical protein
VVPEIDGERVYVDKQLGFYRALGFRKSSVFSLLTPGFWMRVYRNFANGFRGTMDTSEGFLHGGVLAVAPARCTGTGSPQVVFEHREEALGGTMAESPEATARLLVALERIRCGAQLERPAPGDTAQLEEEKREL